MSKKTENRRRRVSSKKRGEKRRRRTQKRVRYGGVKLDNSTKIMSTTTGGVRIRREDKYGEPMKWY
jgi:hypothetical protein